MTLAYGCVASISASMCSRDQIVREARGAAETAAAHRHRLARRRGGAAGERQHDLEIGAACQPLRKHPRLGRAAENEDAWHVAS